MWEHSPATVVADPARGRLDPEFDVDDEPPPRFMPRFMSSSERRRSSVELPSTAVAMAHGRQGEQCAESVSAAPNNMIAIGLTISRILQVGMRSRCFRVQHPSRLPSRGITAPWKVMSPVTVPRRRYTSPR